MSNPLAAVWQRADGAETIFTGDEVGTWPDNRVELLRKTGLIRPVGNTNCVVCDACASNHVEEVTLIESPPDSPARAYIHCPDNGRIAVPLERLRQWAIDFNGLAKAVASGLNLAGEVEEVAGGRIWYLGKATIAGRSRGVFLARGATWSDAPAKFGQCDRLNASRGSLLLVPGNLPPKDAWAGDLPTVAPLKLITQLVDKHLSFDLDHIEGLFSGDRRKAPVKAQEAFPTPPGTQWQELMVWVTDFVITIEAKRRNRDVSFDVAGFEEKRKRDVPDAIWGLLRIFAMRSGVIPYDGAGLDDKTRTNLKQYVSVLRKRLCALIPGIGGDPVPYIKDEHCYRMAFKIASQDIPVFPVPDGTKWPDVTIELTGTGTIRVSVPTMERYAASAYAEKSDGETHQWETAERESVLERDYNLRMIGLADNNSQLDPRGAALLDVLRGEGVVSRSAEDNGMIDLCGVLTSLMDGLEGSPFEFASDKWISLFQVSCEPA